MKRGEKNEREEGEGREGEETIGRNLNLLCSLCVLYVCPVFISAHARVWSHFEENKELSKILHSVSMDALSKK